MFGKTRKYKQGMYAVLTLNNAISCDPRFENI